MKNSFYFKRDLFQSVGSAGIGALLTLVTTPIMTRLYLPEAYGMNVLVLTITTTIASLGLLGLPVALAREKDREQQINLIDASSQIMLIIIICCIFAAAVIVSYAAVPFDSSLQIVLFLFPLLIFLNAIQRISDSLVNARGQFRAQAISRVGGAVVARGLTLALGWLGYPVAASMLAGDGAGKASHVALTVKFASFWADARQIRWMPDFRFLLRTIRQHREFVFKANLAAILPTFVTLGIQTMLGVRLGVDAMGYFALAQSILTLPVTIISLASAPVVFHKLVLVADSTPERLLQLTIKALIAYLTVGVVLMVPIILFGSGIFSIVFGENWKVAGVTASILAIPQILSFGLIGVLSVFRVVRKTDAWFRLELFGTVLILCGVFLIPQQADLVTAMIILAKLNFCYNIVMLSGCIWAARQ